MAVLVTPKPADRAALDYAAKVKASAGASARVTELAWDASERTLDETLALAPAVVPAEWSARVVIVGDECLDASAAAAAERLAAQGLPVDVVMPPTAALFPRIAGARPVSEVRAGVPFEIAVAVDNPSAEGAPDLRVRVERSSAGGEPADVGSAPLGQFAGRKCAVVADRASASGLYLYSIALEGAPAGTPAFRLPVEVLPPLRALVVHDAETPVDHLKAALAAGGIDVTAKGPAELREPVGDRGAEWEDYDVVILVNVSAPELGAQRGESLRRWVFDGGGLVMAGGPKSFGCGGWYRTDLERALPVTMDPLREPPVYALFVVFDKSWSMGDSVSKEVHKVDFIREAAIAAATPLAPHDFFGLLSFDSQPHVILELHKIADRKLVTGTISTLGAFGTTNFYRALAKAQELLKDVKATYKHIVLLSDGRSSVPNLNYQLLLESMAMDRLTVSTVGIGTDCHKELLAQIASWGKGQAYYTPTADRIPQVLLDESSRMKEILTVEVPSPVKPALADGALDGVDLSKCPELLGFNRVRARESADTLLTVSHKDEPLLCLWYYGTGRSAAFASDAGPRWSAQWIDKWPQGYAKLWQRMVSAVARAPAGDSGLRAVPAAWGREMTFEAVDSWGSPVTGLDAYADVRQWRQGRWLFGSHALSESAPGVYHVELSPAESARAPCVVQVVRRWETSGDRVLATLVGPSPGVPAAGAAERARLAQECARVGGGRVNPEPAALFETPRAPITRQASIQGPMLLAALALFFADVIVRRWAAIARLFRRDRA